MIHIKIFYESNTCLAAEEGEQRLEAARRELGRLTGAYQLMVTTPEGGMEGERTGERGRRGESEGREGEGEGGKRDE